MWNVWRKNALIKTFHTGRDANLWKKQKKKGGNENVVVLQWWRTYGGWNWFMMEFWMLVGQNVQFNFHCCCCWCCCGRSHIRSTQPLWLADAKVWKNPIWRDKGVAFLHWDVWMVWKHIWYVIFMVIFCANNSEENPESSVWRPSGWRFFSVCPSLVLSPDVHLFAPPPPLGPVSRLLFACHLTRAGATLSSTSASVCFYDVPFCAQLGHQGKESSVAPTAHQPLIQPWLGHRKKPPSWLAPEESGSRASWCGRCPAMFDFKMSHPGLIRCWIQTVCFSVDPGEKRNGSVETCCPNYVHFSDQVGIFLRSLPNKEKGMLIKISSTGTGFMALNETSHRIGPRTSYMRAKSRGSLFSAAHCPLIHHRDWQSAIIPPFAPSLFFSSPTCQIDFCSPHPFSSPPPPPPPPPTNPSPSPAYSHPGEKLIVCYEGKKRTIMSLFLLGWHLRSVCCCCAADRRSKQRDAEPRLPCSPAGTTESFFFLVHLFIFEGGRD